ALDQSPIYTLAVLAIISPPLMTSSHGTAKLRRAISVFRIGKPRGSFFLEHDRSINRTEFRLRSFGFILLSSLILASSAVGQGPATVGQWSAVMTWPYSAVHAHVLPTGKVLWWP